MTDVQTPRTDVDTPPWTYPVDDRQIEREVISAEDEKRYSTSQFAVIKRRFLRNRPIFEADRGHIHHKLLERGLSPQGTVLTIYAFCAVVAGLSRRARRRSSSRGNWMKTARPSRSTSRRGSRRRRSWCSS